jgi:lipopolysaccharide heptosyltransferase I
MPRPPAELTRLEPRRVVILKPSSLGDVVHALPVLAALRDRWPAAHLAWVVNRGLRGLLEGNPLLDEVIPFDRAAVRPTPGGVRRLGGFLLGLRRRRFDLAIDLQGLLRSGLMAAATGAPTRVGLASAREGAPRFYTHRLPEPEPRGHAVDRLLHVAAAFGADVRAPRFAVAMSEADRLWAGQVLAALPRPRLVLNVGARWETKRWPPERFAEVARRAAADLGAGLIAVGAPEDAPLVARLKAALDGVPLLDLVGRTSLPQLAAVAAASDLFLSNDTGPLHLAAAAGARTIGVYTCTRPEWTGPYGADAEAIRSGIWCAGSCVKTCDRLDCMAELTADRVWLAVARGLRPAAPITPAA